MLKKVNRLLRTGGPGLIGQAGSFAAMLLPLLFGRMQQVGFVVLVSAIAVVLARVCSLSVQALYPVLAEEKTAVARAATVQVTLAISIIGGIAAAVSWYAGYQNVGSTILWSVLMVIPMVGYQLVNAMFVRNSSYSHYGVVRLFYGLFNVVFVALVLATMPVWIPALALAGCAAYAFGWGLGTILLKEPVVAGALRVPVRKIYDYVRSHAETIGSQIIDVVGAQAPALSIGAVDVSSGAGAVWSGLQRTAGGVVTTLTILVAPSAEMKVAASVRDATEGSTRKIIGRYLRYAVLIALGGAIITVPATIAILSFNQKVEIGIGIVAMMLLHVMGIFLLSMINKLLIMVGAIRSASLWSTLRALSSVVLLGTLNGNVLIYAICIQSASFAGLFIVLLHLAVQQKKGVSRK